MIDAGRVGVGEAVLELGLTITTNGQGANKSDGLVVQSVDRTLHLESGIVGFGNRYPTQLIANTILVAGETEEGDGESNIRIPRNNKITE